MDTQTREGTNQPLARVALDVLVMTQTAHAHSMCWRAKPAAAPPGGELLSTHMGSRGRGRLGPRPGPAGAGRGWGRGRLGPKALHYIYQPCAQAAEATLGRAGVTRRAVASYRYDGAVHVCGTPYTASQPSPTC